MSASAADRRHVELVEKCMECDAIAREVERLVAEDNALVQRECSIHGLIERRVAALRAEQRVITGLVDGGDA